MCSLKLLVSESADESCGQIKHCHFYKSICGESLFSLPVKMSFFFHPYLALPNVTIISNLKFIDIIKAFDAIIRPLIKMINGL